MEALIIKGSLNKPGAAPGSEDVKAWRKANGWHEHAFADAGANRILNSINPGILKGKKRARSKVQGVKYSPGDLLNMQQRSEEDHDTSPNLQVTPSLPQVKAANHWRRHHPVPAEELPDLQQDPDSILILTHNALRQPPGINHDL